MARVPASNTGTLDKKICGTVTNYTLTKVVFSYNWARVVNI
jgi:hypothetical protein